jgi:RNA polymerase sigma factor (sigma-70 family)
MDSSTDFRALMERVRAGCPEAARDLYEVYSPHVQRIIRRRLNPRLRAQYDSIDFTQQVWKSFFTGDLADQRFDHPGALVAFLARVASNKVTEEFRRQFLTEKRDLNRERQRAASEYAAVEFPADGPTPSQEVIAGEQMERLMAGQPAHVRRILEMLRQGHTHRAIAAEVGISEKFIQRFLQTLSERHGLR